MRRQLVFFFMAFLAALALTAPRARAALSLNLNGAQGDVAAAVLRFETSPEGHVSVIDSDGQTLVDALGLELFGQNETDEEEAATVLPAVGKRPPRARLRGVTYSLAVTARRCGGGTVLDFQGVPGRREDPSIWKERKAVRVRLVARLAPTTMEGGRAILGDDRMVTLGATDRVPRDGPTGRPPEEVPDGRRLELHPASGRPFYVETETPSRMAIVRKEGRTLVILAEALVEPDAQFAYAVFLGHSPYEGAPALLAEPRTRFDESHACFEVSVRAFGAWEDPYDCADVAFGLAGRASLGYYTRDYVSVLDDGSGEEDVAKGHDSVEDAATKEVERLEPRRWPYFALRLPYSMSGQKIAVAFETGADGAGSASARAGLLLPTVDTRRHTSRRRRLSGPTISARSPRGTAELVDSLAEIARADVPAARLEALGEGWQLSAALSGSAAAPANRAERDLQEDPPAIDLEAAWRVDRAMAEAGDRGLRLSLVCHGYRTPDDVLAAEAMLVERLDDWLRLERYALSRWGSSAGYGGLEIPGDPEAAGALLLRDETIRADRSPEEEATVHRMRRGSMWNGALSANGDVFFDASLVQVAEPEALALARFLTALPATGRLTRSFGFVRSSGAGLLGRRGPEGALWWIETPPPQADRPGETGRAEAVDKAEFDQEFEFCIRGLRPGRYHLEWWDPFAGLIVTSSEVRVTTSNVGTSGEDQGDGTLDLTAPPFTNEISGRLVRVHGPTYSP